jgi:hypothetical protein
LTSTAAGLFPLLSPERAEQHHPGVVDQRLGAAEGRAGLLCRRHHGLTVGDIGGDRHSAIAELGRQRLQTLDSAGQQR